MLIYNRLPEKTYVSLEHYVPLHEWPLRHNNTWPHIDVYNPY